MRAENFKRLKAIRVHPDGNLVVIGGILGRRGHEGVRTKRIGEYLVTFERMQTPSDLPPEVQIVLGPYMKQSFA